MGRPAILKVQILSDANTRGIDQTDSALRKLTGFATKAGLAIAGAVTAIGAAAFKFASEAQQAAGGMAAVFGTNAGIVESKAKAAAKAVGLSYSEYGNYATILGSQLKNMGTAGAQLAPKTDDLIKLGADLAATYGGTVSDAVSALSSLLRGERDPIERYGVSITAADVAARKAELGLSGLTGEADKQATAQATLALLTEQSAAAQGQFGREANTAAGAQARLTATGKNLLAQLGQQLLPVFVAVADWLTNSVIPAISGFASQLNDWLGPAITAVGGWVQTTLIPALASMWDWVQAKVVPILISLWGIIQDNIIPIFSGWWSLLTDKVIPIIAGLWDWLVSKVVPVIIGSLRPALEKARDGFQFIFDKVGAVLTKAEPLIGFFKDVFSWAAEKLAPVLMGALGGAFIFVANVVGGVIGVLGSIIDRLKGIVDWAKKAGDAIKNFIQDQAAAEYGYDEQIFQNGRGPLMAGPLTAAYAGGPASPTTGARIAVSPRFDVTVKIGDDTINAIVERVYQRLDSRQRRLDARPKVVTA